MYNKSCIMFLFLMMFLVEVVMAQDETRPDSPPNPPIIESTERYVPEYEAGQGGVSVGMGALFPLFFQKFTGEYITRTHLSVGGSGWFSWDIYLWKALSAGMEIGGMFALTPNKRFLLMAPITAHLKYIFQVYPIEFPVELALGANLVSLSNDFKVDFILKPKVGITYRINQNWSVGLFTAFWFDVQSYQHSADVDNAYSRLGNFLDLTAGFSYVF